MLMGQQIATLGDASVNGDYLHIYIFKLKKITKFNWRYD
jgi:hypothetical protein